MANEPSPIVNEEQGVEIPAAAPPVSTGDAIVTAFPKRLGRRRRLAKFALGLLLVWLIVAYLVMPTVWKSYARRHPSLEDIPRITHTGSNIPGDPLNVALIGTEMDLNKLMLAAKWCPADRITLRSCLRIALDTTIRRSYEEAPVSNLYLFGRKQDLAFQQAVGNNPRQRHHVRFWRSDEADPDGRPVWIGAAIYDRRVGLSHTTGQITHHTAADIDTERDKLFADLKQTGHFVEDYIIEGFHAIRQGRNGGGDRWNTDGNLVVGVIKAAIPPKEAKEGSSD